MVHIMQREGMAQKFLADIVMMDIDRIGKWVCHRLVLDCTASIDTNFGRTGFEVNLNCSLNVT
jgi:hypothetical protein